MVLAQLDLSNEEVNPIAKFSDLASIINLIIPLLMAGGALIFFAMMLIGAYTFMTAAGDAEKVKQAQKMFKFAIFGFIIVFVSFLMIKVIEIILGITILP